MSNDILRLTDYGSKKISEEQKNDLQEIANKPIKDLENKSIYVIKSETSAEKDDIFLKSHIIDIHDNTITTKKLVGFIKVKNTQLEISSRFSKGNDFFLYYMLEKIYDYRIFDFKTEILENNILNFLPLSFPEYLKNALDKCVYKKYMWKNYNNSNIKGSIDIARHIKQNIPFNYKVAYRTREHSYNNEITHLLRHTIEYIGEHHLKGILNGDDLREYIMQIMDATTNYNRFARDKIIKQNSKTLRESYFHEYEDLRKLCLRILKEESVIYKNNEADETYGLLFDITYLWEKYLLYVLKKKFDVKYQQTKDLFLNDDTMIKPDFVINNTMIADAKYKLIDEDKNSDYYQLITYMLYYKSKISYLLFPYTNDKNEIELKFPNNIDFSFIKKIGLKISSESDEYNKFKDEMEKNENEFYKQII
jgi:5-methylcytosine-specific restriction endonuclease McrBC regulatory subunit McrC